MQTTRIANMIWDIKNALEGENDPSNKAGKTLDLVVKFKKEHPQDFNELFEILKDLIQEYEQNPDEIKKNLKEILK
nr:hypothetical protein [Helicobacter pylori]